MSVANVNVKITAASKAVTEVPYQMRTHVVDALRGIGADWERYVKESIGPGGKTNQGGPRLHNRTGALRRSVRFKLNKSRMAVRLMVGGKGAPHAGLQEYGGTVRPTRRKYLTVPLSNAKTASGAISGSARIRPAGLRKTRKGKIRRVFKTDRGETFIYRSRRGNLIVAVKPKTKKPNLKRDSLYVLKKSVRVRPRLGAWDAVRLDGPRGNAIRRRLVLATKRAFP